MTDRVDRTRNAMALIIFLVAVFVGGAMRIDATVRLYGPNEISPSDPSLCYEPAADSFLAGDGMLPYSKDDPRGNFIPPPLHPAFIAAMKAIFPTGDYHTMRSVLAMFSIFSIALAYLVGAQLGTRLTGAFAAFVVAVDPDLIHWVSMLLTETNFFFLLFAFLAALLYAVRKDTARSMALAGALLGVCCLQRPIPMFLAILIPAFLVIRYRSGRRLVQGAVFFLACVAMISPWTIRNYARYGAFYPVSTNGGHQLARSNFPALDSADPEMRYLNRIWPTPVWRDPAIEAEFEGRKDTYGYNEWNQKDKAYARRTFRYIRENPGHFLRNYCLKVYNSLRGPITPSSRKHLNIYDIRGRSLVERGLYRYWRNGLVILGLSSAVWFALRERRGPRLVMLLVLLYFIGISGLVIDVSSARYSLPMKILISFFAAYGLAALVEMWMCRSARRAGPSEVAVTPAVNPSPDEAPDDPKDAP